MVCSKIVLFLPKSKAMKQQIPNLITLLNVLCGCIATVFAVANQLEMTALFVCLGIFFDFTDGLAARLLDARSALGIQLDSLADMITSGLVPGIVMFQLLNMSEMGGWNISSTVSWARTSDFTMLPLFGFLITLASAYRLAKFNIDENQATSFIGLPTPANSLLIISLPLILLYHNNNVLNRIILNPWFLMSLTLLSAYMLNSKMQLFALKFENWGFKDNALRYIFILVSLVLLLTMRFLAIPLIIIFYVVASLVQNLTIQKE